jgi:hypothetical protein
MKSLVVKIVAAGSLAATTVAISPPAFAIPEVYTATITCPNGIEISVTALVGQAPDYGECLRRGNVVAGPRAVNPRIIDAVSGAVIQAPDGLIDINQASPRSLGSIRTLNADAIAALVKDRERTPFANAEDLAIRACNRSSIDLSGVDIRIGRTTYIRNTETKAAGFKCTAGDGSYEIMGKKHNYVGHVTLLR